MCKGLIADSQYIELNTEEMKKGSNYQEFELSVQIETKWLGNKMVY